ncbi:unnamed protein product [Orchesella dallaii]|uniref:PH domain-containing protein n=1 Tax=Orchesella dallaii TaxID=48710 RepID=A0ABP1R9V6_9HEXA
MVTDCPKFIPNIFNNSKCSSCFKTREEHGDVSLDSKSMRRVIKCGYLFIAPRDWDFCNPSAHRTKRWQRRWFVLYSDDQLTWSIDDHPDTIPQGSLEMREILEVKNAEDITENPHSLALTGKATTFIKGVNKEDIASWTAVLTKYGNKVLTTAGGKRSLTLPGGFGSGTTRFETGVVIGPSRQRFHSVTASPGLAGLTSPVGVGPSSYNKCFVESPTNNRLSSSSSSSPSSMTSMSTASMTSEGHHTPSRHQQLHHHILQQRQDNISVSENVSGSPGGSSMKGGLLSMSKSSTGASPIGGDGDNRGSSCSNNNSNNKAASRSVYLSLSNVPKGKSYRNFPGAVTPVVTSSSSSPASSATTSRILPPPLLSPSSSAATTTSASVKLISQSACASPSEPATSPQSSSSSYTKCYESSSDVTDSIQYSHSHCPTNSVRALRGDPDGCGGLDASDSGPLRKGWLLKQMNSEWLKHWFVLKNNQLIYYENSEELNPLGTIEVTDETAIKQFDSSRHYGFEIMNKSTVHKLSAITNGMRGIWMKALESAKVKVRDQRDSEIIQPPPAQIANPPSPPLKSKKSRWRKKSDLKLFDSLKDEFAERERELDSFQRSGTDLSRGESPRMREILKSQAVQIDSFRTQLSSGFMEIEKLEMFCKSREAEYAESLKCKDEIIEELRDQLTREISVREKLELQAHELEQQVQLLSDKVAKVQSLLSETERELDQTNINQRELGRITESQQMQLKQELDLLRHRCNDLTEKLYQSEKTAKTLKTKLGRVKSQSLKDRQIESDVISKIHDLEEKISKFDKSPLSPSSTTSGASLSLPPSASLPTSPTESTPGAVASSGGSTPAGGKDGGIINVIMKLNDLDQRVEKVTESLWFRRGELEDYVGECHNCKILEMEVRERDERLEVLEGNLKKLELEFDKKMQELREFVKEQPSPQEASPSYSQSTNKYQVEIEQLRNLCAKGLEAMENSHRRMIMELEEKHRRELQNLRIEKEQELAEETKATLSALDAMRKNHQLELQREMAKFKEEFMRKFQCNQDLSDLHREHEEELHEVKTEILRLTEKYSLKCVEASKLEETITYLKSQLNEAKRRIIEMEASDFQSCISSATKVQHYILVHPFFSITILTVCLVCKRLYMYLNVFVC